MMGAQQGAPTRGTGLHWADGRYRIMAALAPRLATCNPPEGQVAAAGGTVTLQRLGGVHRAGGLEAAGRAQPGTKEQTVNPNTTGEQTHHHAKAPFSVNSESNSVRIACFKAMELALKKRAGSKPERSRTT